MHVFKRRSGAPLAAALPAVAALFLLTACPPPAGPDPLPGDDPIVTPDPDPDPDLPGGLAIWEAIPSSVAPVPLDSSFLVRFDKDIEASTAPDGLRLLKEGTAVEASVHFDPYSPKQLFLDPAADLVPGATYVLEATTSLRATDGSSLGAAWTRTYVAAVPMAPSITAYRASTMLTTIADGAWTNDDVRAKASRPSAYPGGTLSILWSLDGEAWTESTGTPGTSTEQTRTTADGEELRIKARYSYDGVAYESDPITVRVDKTRPRVISCEEPAHGRLVVELSEPVYKSTAGLAPTSADFGLQSAELWGAQFTVTAVEGSGASWTLDYTYRDSNGDHVELVAAGMDLAGNRTEWFETGVVTLKAPTGYTATVVADGTIAVDAALGPDFGDGFAAAAPTDDTDWGLSWSASADGAPVTFTGLELETRYYLRVANTISTVGRSKGVKVPVWGARNYLYPVLPFDEGSGTEIDPWLIRNRADLENMLDDAAMRDDHFRLAADLDLSRYPWISVGFVGSFEFTGAFDGAGFSIAGGATELWNGGIFAKIRDAGIRNLLIDGARIDGDYRPQGAVANEAYGSSLIENVGVEGLEVTGGSWTGGLVGYAGKGSEDDNAVVVRRSYVTGKVTASDQGYVGGIAGSATEALIEDCFAAVDIVDTTRDYCAGLVGDAEHGTVIRRAYATGAIDTTGCGSGLVGIHAAATVKPVLENLVAMNPSIGESGYDSTYDKRYRAVYASVGTYPLSNFATASGIYANSAMAVDGATVADSDVNGTGMSIVAFKSAASACFAAWDFTVTGPWIMGTDGPLLRDMPLGGGTYGIPSLDPVAWD
ncbi:MAG: hypothetical protein JXA15_12545 [Spirochaetales bacterium]|nr:hypothetical protein [Spirochaetales bacterium]